MTSWSCEFDSSAWEILQPTHTHTHNGHRSIRRARQLKPASEKMSWLNNWEISSWNEFNGKIFEAQPLSLLGGTPEEEKKKSFTFCCRIVLTHLRRLSMTSSRAQPADRWNSHAAKKRFKKPYRQEAANSRCRVVNIAIRYCWPANNTIWWHKFHLPCVIWLLRHEELNNQIPQQQQKKKIIDCRLSHENAKCSMRRWLGESGQVG